jgi:hypothetical protein
MSASTVASAVDPLLRPRIVVDPFDAEQREKRQRAASEGRLEPVGVYSVAAPSNTASYMNVLSGILGFITFIIAMPLTVTGYIGHRHSTEFAINGIMVTLFILANLAIGYITAITHQGFHIIACKLMGGTAGAAQVEPYRFKWSAPSQAFSRNAYIAILIAPLIAFTLLWVIVWIIAPGVAAFLIVALVVNVVASGEDLWLIATLLRQPDTAEVFVDTLSGYVAYAVTATKPARKKPTTTPLGNDRPTQKKSS